jgi:hypothetical protein
MPQPHSSHRIKPALLHQVQHLQRGAGGFFLADLPLLHRGQVFQRFEHKNSDSPEAALAQSAKLA